MKRSLLLPLTTGPVLLIPPSIAASSAASRELYNNKMSCGYTSVGIGMCQSSSCARIYVLEGNCRNKAAWPHGDCADNCSDDPSCLAYSQSLSSSSSSTTRSGVPTYNRCIYYVDDDDAPWTSDGEHWGSGKTDPECMVKDVCTVITAPPSLAPSPAPSRQPRSSPSEGASGNQFFASYTPSGSQRIIILLGFIIGLLLQVVCAYRKVVLSDNNAGGGWAMPSPSAATNEITFVDEDDGPMDLEERKRKEDEIAPADEDEGPMDGVGCANGCIRDKHLVVTFLTLGLVVIPILWATGIISLLVLAIVEGLIGQLYLNFSLKSNSFQYLRNVVTAEDVSAFMDRMYQTKPEICWSIQCYHTETHTRQVSSTDANRNTTETYTERVNTHSAKGKLKFVRWQDKSTPLQRTEIENCRMTKVSVKKTWQGDEGALAQKEEFIRVHDLDDHYNFSETLNIEGYRPRFLGFVDLKDVPLLAHWGWYVASHLTVVFGVPYRMWLSSKTGKVKSVIVKQVWTESAGETRESLPTRQESPAAA